MTAGVLFFARVLGDDLGESHTYKLRNDAVTRRIIAKHAEANLNYSCAILQGWDG